MGRPLELVSSMIPDTSATFRIDEQFNFKHLTFHPLETVPGDGEERSSR